MSRYRRPVGETVVAVLRMEMTLAAVRSHLRQEMPKHESETGEDWRTLEALQKVLDRLDVDPMDSGKFESQTALVLVLPDEEWPGQMPGWRRKAGEVLWHDGGVIDYELSSMGIDSWDDHEWPKEPGVYLWKGTVAYRQSGGYEYPHEYDMEMEGEFKRIPTVATAYDEDEPTVAPGENDV